MSEDARSALEALVQSRGEDYASLSRLIGRNPAYIQQFIRRGTPKRLAERDRRLLADYFRVDEDRLGGPPPPVRDDLVHVPLLDVGASAGAGREVAAEREAMRLGFPRAMLRELAAGAPDRLSMIRVEGRSMEPALGDGDTILVDGGDAAERLRDGIYVLRLEGGLMVKRLARTPRAKRIDVISDNPDYPRWDDLPLAELEIIGRVVWAGRRIG